MRLSYQIDSTKSNRSREAVLLAKGWLAKTCFEMAGYQAFKPPCMGYSRKKKHRRLMKLQGRVAFITGGGKGIGKQIARLFALEGADLVLAGPTPRDLKQVNKIIEDIGRRCITRKVDVAVEDQVNAVVEAAIREFGQIDILVNNAAVLGPTVPFIQLSSGGWERELAVNLTGPFFCSKAVLPGMMQRRKGKIINIASVAGQRAYPLRSPYAVSKWGLIGLTRTLAQEMGPHNVQVNAVAPGPVQGRRMEQVIEERAKEMGTSIEEVERSYLASLALGRMAEEDDVAQMVLFLASRGGDNITGQVFNVCAGYKL